MEHITVKDLVEATQGRLLVGNEATQVEHLSINSNEIREKTLFVPLIGERVDAHQFIEQALEAGAVATLTSQRMTVPVPITSQKAWILVADTKKALQRIGSYLRQKMTMPLIGVTGSVGKTTTRQMISWALSAKYEVFQTPKNYNGQVGVPLSLSEISDKDQFAVIEMGMSEPGEMAVLSNIARVNTAVVTNIGEAHLEQLKTRANICHEKLAIQDGMPYGSTLFLNGDDDLLCQISANEGNQVIFYGTGEHCHYRAKDIEMINGCPIFTLVYDKQQYRVQLQLRGRHFVDNTLVAIAVAHAYGISIPTAIIQMEGLTELENRQNIFVKDEITVIDDAYNASPVSMKAGIEVLCSMNLAARRIAVLADMKELGSEEQLFHRQIGDFLADQSVDMVLTLGTLAKEIGTSISRKNDQIAVYQFEEKKSLSQQLKDLLKPGDCVLFKGSNSMRLSEVIKEVF